MRNRTSAISRLVQSIPVSLVAVAIMIGYSVVVTGEESSEKVGGSGKVDSSVIAERQSYHEHLLRKEMFAMSSSVISLFALDNLDSIDNAERQRRILDELDKLEQVARVLVNNVEINNYSVQSPYMGSFLHDVGMAREFALMVPPDFKPSTGLIKSCLLCHETLE